VGPWQHDRLEKRGSSRRRDSAAWQNALGEHIGHKKRCITQPTGCVIKYMDFAEITICTVRFNLKCLW
jgi:hypothetical protein